jgi:histidyl-tRNA synthetase
MTHSIPRGTKDILPSEMPYWHLIENTAKQLFSVYNYKEIRTPIFEHAELFEQVIGQGTDIVEKEMYTFTDKSDRRLTLRPEGTAPIARTIIQHPELTHHQNAKLYYCGPMFRYERPQAGRYRQFHQIGTEYIGEISPEADIEIISMAYRLFESLGLEKLTVMINSIGDEISRPVINEAIRQFLGNTKWLEKELCPRCLPRFNQNPLRILDCKNEVCNQYISGLPDIKSLQSTACKDHFHSVVDGLKRLKIPFTVNPFLVRGLDYYTRTTFEIVSQNLGAQNAICGGGRYDALIKRMGGKPLPAIGFAFGVERVMLALQAQKITLPEPSPLIFIAPIGYAHFNQGVELLDTLRQAGIKAEMDYTQKEDLKSQLKSANKSNAAYTIIFGEEEAVKKIVIIKNMKTGNQVDVPDTTIIDYLRKNGL